MLIEIEAQESTAEMKERFMHIGPSFVANTQATELIEPGKRALHQPAMASQAFFGFDATTSDAWGDATLTQGSAADRKIVGFVSVQFGGAFASSAPAPTLTRGPNGIDHFEQYFRVMNIRSRQFHRQRDASPIDHKMALRARFAAIRWIRSGFGAPPGAGMLEASTDARFQSITPASPKRSNNT